LSPHVSPVSMPSVSPAFSIGQPSGTALAQRQKSGKVPLGTVDRCNVSGQRYFPTGCSSSSLCSACCSAGDVRKATSEHIRKSKTHVAAAYVSLLSSSIRNTASRLGKSQREGPAIKDGETPPSRSSSVNGVRQDQRRTIDNDSPALEGPHLGTTRTCARLRSLRIPGQRIRLFNDAKYEITSSRSYAASRSPVVCPAGLRVAIRYSSTVTSARGPWDLGTRTRTLYSRSQYEYSTLYSTSCVLSCTHAQG
jgi:hypothetical protein